MHSSAVDLNMIGLLCWFDSGQWDHKRAGMLDLLRGIDHDKSDHRQAKRFQFSFARTTAIRQDHDCA